MRHRARRHAVALHGHSEEGQAAVEMGLILIILLMLTAGLVDVGRGFYQYNALSNAARYGARWAAVVGGTCEVNASPSINTSDWCNNYATATTHSDFGFWNMDGNHPLQTDGSECPSSYDSSNAADWYSYSSSYYPSSSTTIVGAVFQHLDSNSSGANKNRGAVLPGLDLRLIKVCIFLPASAYVSGTWEPVAGDTVAVYVYYPFQPAGPLFGRMTLPLMSSSRYIVECCSPQG